MAMVNLAIHQTPSILIAGNNAAHPPSTVLDNTPSVSKTPIIMDKKNIVTKIGLIALVLWLIAIIGVGMGSFLPSLAPPAIHHIDLYVHFAAYALLAGLPLFITQSLKWRSISIILIIAIGLGVEWAQSYIPGRTGSLDDAVANLIGISLGALVSGALSHRLLWYLDTVRMNKERLLNRSTTPNQS